jgi:hypothetical protein
MTQSIVPFLPVITSGDTSPTTEDLVTPDSWSNYPGRCDLTFYQGDDVTVTLNIEDPSDLTPDFATDCEWSAEIRQYHTYLSTLLNTFSVTDVYTAPDPGPPEVVGYTTVTLFLPRSENVWAGCFRWELFCEMPIDLTDFPRPPDVPEPEPWPPTTQVRTFIYGIVTILPRVSATDSLPVP